MNSDWNIADTLMGIATAVFVPAGCWLLLHGLLWELQR